MADLNFCLTNIFMTKIFVLRTFCFQHGGHGGSTFLLTNFFLQTILFDRKYFRTEFVFEILFYYNLNSSLLSFKF